MYTLGIDLGTTFTAAATWRDSHAEIASLGSRAAVIPSVVLLREDETVLTGETAHRRGLTEPHRVSREFKRRLGDTTPILLGGVPYSAEALMGRLLRSVIDEVAQRQGEQPSAICVSHPANWGPYKKDLLAQAARLSNIDRPVTFTTEPEAAAVFYARQQRVEAGAVVAVYDLGGGTFDAAVLRKTATGFEILGQPEGIERLGGIDFDAAVFSHVTRALGSKLDELDEDDPATIAAVARLREECVEAKEVLSADTDASIPVLLPNVSTEVRLTRAELEAMVRPALHSTIEALRRALRSAGVTAAKSDASAPAPRFASAPDKASEQLHSVLLIGGSSRMPLVAQLVGAELGRPVAVDAHPKHAVALGAAWLASGTAATGPAAEARPATAAGPATAAAAPPSRDPHRTYAGAATVPSIPTSPAAPTSPAPPVAPPHRAATPTRFERATAPVSPAVRATASTTPATYGSAASPPPLAPPRPSGSRPGPRRRLLVVAGAALAMVLAAGTVAWAVTRNTDDGGGGPGPLGTDAPSQAPDDTNENPVEDPPESPATPADELCTEEIQSNERWVCLTSAVMEGNDLVIHYDVEWAGSIPDINGGYHLHLYGGDGTTPSDEIMGAQAENRGVWKIRDQNPAVLSADDIADAVGNAPKVCVRIADGEHHLVPDTSGGYTTGNCVPIER